MRIDCLHSLRRSLRESGGVAPHTPCDLSGCLDVRVSGCLDVWKSGCLDVRVSEGTKTPDIRTSRHRDIRTSRQLFLPTFLLVALLAYLPGPVLAGDPQVTTLEDVSLPEFKPPRIQIHTFENGLKVFFLKNRELPVIQMSAFIEAGGIHEAGDKKGLSGLTMAGLRIGGGKDHTGDEIDSILEQVAAYLSVDAGGEYSTVTIKSLRKDLDLALSLFFELLRAPAFEEEKLELIRRQMQDEIGRRNENPGDVARREFAQRLYGEENIWARYFSSVTVRSLTREDVVSFYERFFAPNRIRLAVSGDIPFSLLLTKIQTQMNGWGRREVTYPSLAPVEKKWARSLEMIPMDVTQSVIAVGHFGDKRFNPDKYALILANYVLGGSTFGSRLGNRIRTELGLAYSVNSSFGLETDYGAFEIMAGTKTVSTGEVLKEILGTLTDLTGRNPVTQAELDDAKRTILNQLIFQYEDPFKIVEATVRYDFYGYPPNYLQIFQDEIKATSLEKIRGVFQHYFFPESLKILIVGNEKAKEELSAFGKVEILPLDND